MYPTNPTQRRSSRAVVALFTIILLVTFLQNDALAVVAAALDTTFGTGGTVPIATGSPVAVLLGPDDTILVLLSTVNGPAVAKYLPTGAVDNSFGGAGDGIARPDLSALDPQLVAATAFTFQDQSIVVLGDDSQRIVLFRLNSDGLLDSTFGNGTGGTVTDVVSSAVDHDSVFNGCRDASAYAIHAQTDGGLVVVGNTFPNCSSINFNLLLRYTANGTPDPTFGDEGAGGTTLGVRLLGIANVPQLGWYLGPGTAMLSDPNDHFIVGSAPWYGHLRVARLLANGSPDYSFGGTSVVDIPAPAGYLQVTGLALQANGSIVAAAAANDFDEPGQFGNNRYALGRYSATGSPDPTFGDGGVLVDTGPHPSALLLSPDGTLVIIGSGFLNVYDSSGLNCTGKLTTPQATVSAAMQSDGKIVAVGSGTVIRFLSPLASVGVCSILQLTPDPNISSESDVEMGGIAYRYYKVQCTTSTPTGASVVFYDALNNQILGSGLVGDDGTVQIGFESSAIDPNAGSALVGTTSLACSPATLGNSEIVTIGLAPHPLTRGYEINFGAGGSVGPGIQVTGGANFGIGLDFTEQEGKLDSHDDDILSLVRNADIYGGAVFGGKFGEAAGPLKAEVEASATVKAIATREDGFELNDVWNDPDQQKALIGFLLETVPDQFNVKIPKIGPIPPQSFKLPSFGQDLVHAVVDLVTGVQQYRSVVGDGIGASVEGKFADTIGYFNGKKHGFGIKVDTDLDLNATYMEEDFNSTLLHPDASFERSMTIDVGIDLSAVAGVLGSSDKDGKQELSELFGVGNNVGAAGGMSVRAVFSPDGLTVQRAEVELSRSRDFGHTASYQQVGLQDSAGVTQSNVYTFDGDAAEQVAQSLAAFSDAFNELVYSTQADIIYGPTRASSSATDILRQLATTPYTYERKRTLAASAGESLDIGGGDWGISIPLSYERQLHSVLRRGRGEGVTAPGQRGPTGRLYITEDYPAGQFTQNDLLPDASSLISDVTGSIIESAIESVFQIGDSCGLFTPLGCIGSVFSDLGSELSLAIAQNSRLGSAASASPKPDLGIGGYHVFAPNGLILTPEISGTLNASNGRASLAVTNGVGTLAISYDPSEVSSAWENSLRVHQWIDAQKRWRALNGTVDPILHRVTAAVTTLGAFTLSPVVPTGEIQIEDAALDRSGSASVSSMPIRGSDGKVVTDGTLVTIALKDPDSTDNSDISSVIEPDLDPSVDGTQVATHHGRFLVHFVAPASGNIVVEAASVFGDANGVARFAVHNGDLSSWSSTFGGFQVSQFTTTIPRRVGLPGKYSLTGMIDIGNVSFDAAPFVFSLTDSAGGVFSVNVPSGLRPTGAGKWDSVTPRVTVRRKGAHYQIKIRGEGDLGALTTADLRAQLVFGSNVEEGRIIAGAKAGSATLKMKLLK